MVAKSPPFWHRCSIIRPLGRPEFGCGCSSGVEHDLAKVGVEGSNPFARSKFIHAINGWYRLQLCLGPALLRGGGGSEAAEEQFGSGFRLPSPSPVLISIPVVALRSEELRVPPSAVLVCAVSL